MLIPRNNRRYVFIVSPKLIQAHLVPRLYIVPTPYELIKSLFLWFLRCYHLWMTCRIVHFTQLLHCHLRTHHLPHSVVCILDRLCPVLVQLSSQVSHEIPVWYVVPVPSEIVANVCHFFLCQVQLAALQPPSEIVFVQWSSVLLVQTFKNLMQKSYPVNSSFCQQMLHLLVQSVLIDDVVLYLRLIELLRGIWCA